jgi:phenylacetate-CoA ligase
LILKQPKLSPHYLIEVWRDGHLDSFAVDVELKREYRYLPAVDKEYVAHTLQRHIKSFVGISTEVRIVDIGGIERSLGKARRVIDRRPGE